MQRDGQYLDENEAQMPPQPLEKQEMTADVLLANVSHALRSPLTVIKGSAETLLRLEQRISQQECHEFLQTIKEASDELERRSRNQATA
jgi:K+-sensing histidine kinase KdpD